MNREDEKAACALASVGLKLGIEIAEMASEAAARGDMKNIETVIAKAHGVADAIGAADYETMRKEFLSFMATLEMLRAKARRDADRILKKLRE